MEDYDVFLEMKNIQNIKVIAIVEDDEKFITEKLLNLEKIELMPIRLTYNLGKFSKNYIKETEHLFTYYYNAKNTIENEKLRLKKHFIHYRRVPFIAYIDNVDKNKSLMEIFKELNIEICFDKKIILDKIIGENKNG